MNKEVIVRLVVLLLVTAGICASIWATTQQPEKTRTRHKVILHD